MPSVPLYLKSGKLAPFRPSQYKVSILATNDGNLLQEIDIAISRGIGGLIEISESEYLALRDGTKPEISREIPNYKLLREIAHGRFKAKLVDSGIRTVGKFIHAVERHAQRDDDAERRVENAAASWDYHYANGMKSAQVWENNYIRSSDEEISDSRRLPFLKDVLAAGLVRAKKPDDIVLLTNDDTVLHHNVVQAMKRLLKHVDALSSFRMNFSRENMPALNAPSSKIRQWGESCHGRDLFAFRAQWLRLNWEAIPDFALGAAEWDLALAALVRISAGAPISRDNFSVHDPRCEIERGLVMHETHERTWMLSEFSNSPSARHNNRLYCEFMADNGLEELIGTILA